MGIHSTNRKRRSGGRTSNERRLDRLGRAGIRLGCDSVVLTLASLLAIDCATFSDLPPRAPRNRGEPAFQRLDVFVETGYDPRESTRLWQPQAIRAHERRAIAALDRSGWAREIGETSIRSSADLELRIEAYRRTPSVSLSLFTAGLLPTRHEGNLKLKLTDIRKPPRSCVQVQRYRWWVHLFLVPFMPTYSIGDYELRSVDRLTWRCAHELFRERPGRRSSAEDKDRPRL